LPVEPEGADPHELLQGTAHVAQIYAKDAREIFRRCRGDLGEISGRSGGDLGEIRGRSGGDVREF